MIITLLYYDSNNTNKLKTIIYNEKRKEKKKKKTFIHSFDSFILCKFIYYLLLGGSPSSLSDMSITSINDLFGIDPNTGNLLFGVLL